MSSQVHARPSASFDNAVVERPWAILPIAETLVGRSASTTMRLGMPLVVHDLDEMFLGAKQMTCGDANRSDQFWRIDVTSTDTGIIYENTPRPVREGARRLRDEIARRTRLTREQIARALGVNRRSLTAWVKGDSTPDAEKLRRLQLLADVVRDIDASKPGSATEVLLSRTEGKDLLDHIASGHLTRAQDWHAWQGTVPLVRLEHRQPRKRPLYQNALDAYLRGELSPLGRATTPRPESTYEQDLAKAERLMPDEPVRRSRRGYQ